MAVLEKESPDPLRQESESGHEIGGLADRLNRYGIAHQRALAMADYIQKAVIHPEKNKLLVELRSCGSYLVFRHYYTIGKVLLHGMCSCKKVFLCPLCAIRRAAKFIRAYYERWQILKEKNPKLKAFMVTFTVKDGADLSERFKHLKNSIREYHRQRRDALKKGRIRRPPVEANKAAGAVWSFEIKRGSGSGLFHPHVHAIWLCEDVPDPVRLSKEWNEVTGDSFIVDVRSIEEVDASGFIEVFKYALKFSEMTFEDTWSAFCILRGQRMVSSFGSFRGIHVSEEMIDEDHPEDLPFLELVYRYVQKVGYTLVEASRNGQNDAA